MGEVDIAAPSEKNVPLNPLHRPFFLFYPEQKFFFAHGSSSLPEACALR
jgi:hypothetical protein